MKRNKESKARQRIICTYHLNKKGQRELDESMKEKGIRYAELSKKRFGNLSILSLQFSRLGKRFEEVTKAFTKLANQIYDELKEERRGYE